jgi:hypothetical protein
MALIRRSSWCNPCPPWGAPAERYILQLGASAPLQEASWPAQALQPSPATSAGMCYWVAGWSGVVWGGCSQSNLPPQFVVSGSGCETFLGRFIIWDFFDKGAIKAKRKQEGRPAGPGQKFMGLSLACHRAAFGS